MEIYRIIGLSQPNHVKLRHDKECRVIEMPLRSAKMLYERGTIQVLNPELMYLSI